MTETPQDPPSTRETIPGSPEAVKELLESLVGVASARVVLDGDGSVEELHVLALPDATEEGVTGAVTSALRARFDVKVDGSRVFVARIREQRETPSRPPFAQAVPHGELGPPPWPERTEESGEQDGEGGSSSSRRITGGRAEALESRLLFLGHRTAKRRFKAVEVAVDLQWRGRRHRGAASVRDRSPDRLEAPALATLRALDAALAQRPRDDQPRDVTLTLRGVELVEALGQMHVMVSIVARIGHSRTPLTGTVVVDDSVELATILATLQATDRRVRAVLLNHLPTNGTPPRGPRTDPLR